MCKNASGTAASLLGAIEPTLKSLLAITGQTTTTNGIAAINAFDAAKAALSTWTPGTAPEVAVQALNAFTAVFAVLPIPEEAKLLEGIIVSGIDAVIAVVEANSPAPAAPAPTEGAASTEELQANHAFSVAATAEAKVATQIPGFKRSKFHSADHQYKSEWNKAVEKAGPKYASLKC